MNSKKEEKVKVTWERVLAAHETITRKHEEIRLANQAIVRAEDALAHAGLTAAALANLLSACKSSLQRQVELDLLRLELQEAINAHGAAIIARG